jgi:hypothetical protein
MRTFVLTGAGLAVAGLAATVGALLLSGFFAGRRIACRRADRRQL